MSLNNSQRLFTKAAAVIALLVALLDQLTKTAVREAMTVGASRDILPGLDLVHSRNEGVAFGLLPGGGSLLVVLALAVLLILAIYLRQEADLARFAVPAGLIFGGACGNLIDRLRLGYVTDYIDPVLWPAFNLADIAVVLGVLTLAYQILTKPKAKEID